MTFSRKTGWRVVLVAAVLLGLLTFTPLVTPIGRYEPMLFGMPYTLWTGILVAVCFVGLTLAATRFYPHDEHQQREDV